MHRKTLTWTSALATLVTAVACATTHSARRPAADEGPLVVEMPLTKVGVPAHPDSAWAVATAARMLAGKDSSQHFELLHLCSVTGGYVVDMTPTLRPHPIDKPPIIQLGGGGIVFISLYGEAVIIVAYQ